MQAIGYTAGGISILVIVMVLAGEHGINQASLLVAKQTSNRFCCVVGGCLGIDQ